VGGVPATDLEVGVFDVRGRRVAKLARGPRPPGEPVVWDPRTSGGVSPGIYFVRASAPSAGWRDEAKVVVLR
jgi:hypothetical protein